MLTFKQFILEQIILLENRIAFIKSQFPGKEDLVDRVAANADPTPNKKYTHWIMKQHEQGVSPDDHGRIRSTLEHFSSSAVQRGMKESGDSTDLNKHTLSSLERAIGPHIGKQSGKQEKQEIKSKGSDLIHNDTESGVTVHHLKTKEAACSYGAGTRWCTAGEKDNQFDRYNKEGPLILVQHGGRKYQISNKEMMDEKNHPVSIEDLHPDIQESLSKSNHPYIIRANLEHKNPHTSSDQITAALGSGDQSVRHAAIRHHNVTADHIKMALSNKKDWGLRLIASRHPKARGEDLEKVMNDPNHEVRYEAIKNPNSTSNHVKTALKDKHYLPRMFAASHLKATVEDIHKALKDEHPNIQLAAIKNPNATEGHFEQAMKSKYIEVRGGLMYHPRVPMRIIEKGLKDRSVTVKDAAETAYKRRTSSNAK